MFPFEQVRFLPVHGTKIAVRVAISVYPGQTPYPMMFDLGSHYLPMPACPIIYGNYSHSGVAKTELLLRTPMKNLENCLESLPQ